MTETTSMDLFAEKLCKTVIIGLPGIGTTTMTDYLAGQYTEMSGKTLETVSTDKEMRAYIADRNNPLTDKFLTDRNIPIQEGRRLLETPAVFMEKYTEKTFRDFESAFIVDLLSKGAFNGKVPDLGGKALLHPKTAAAFKEQGYKSIYIKPEKESILLSHIMKDFNRWLTGTKGRSNINRPIEQSWRREQRNTVLGNGWAVRKPAEKKEFKTDGLRLHAELYKKSLDAVDKKAAETAADIMRQMYQDRNPKYEQAATDIVFLSGSLKKDAEKIKAVIMAENANTHISSRTALLKKEQSGR